MEENINGCLTDLILSLLQTVVPGGSGPRARPQCEYSTCTTIVVILMIIMILHYDHIYISVISQLSMLLYCNILICVQSSELDPALRKLLRKAGLNEEDMKDRHTLLLEGHTLR